MATLGAFQARIHFGEVLDRAANGESIEITRNGRHVATIVPAPVRETQSRHREAVDKLLALGEQIRREGRGATHEEILAWRNEGRK